MIVFHRSSDQLGESPGQALLMGDHDWSKSQTKAAAKTWQLGCLGSLQEDHVGQVLLQEV